MLRLRIIPVGLRRTLLSLLAAACVGLAVPGCTEPVTMYQVPGGYVANGQKILILPFMDTRTFIDDNDQHKHDLGYHARNIFIEAMRGRLGQGNVILAPRIPRPLHSMTNAEVAEIGRRHNADVVVAGQVFSFNETRAASIPPRAGMFVRMVSASDGALLFVGDHYQSANIPGASGGRDLQALNVSTRLVEGILTQAGPVAAAIGKIASASALAVFAPQPDAPRYADGGKRVRTGNNKNKPAAETIPGLIGNDLGKSDEWDEPLSPEVPPVLDFDSGMYAPPPPPPVRRDEPAVETDPAGSSPRADSAQKLSADVPEVNDGGSSDNTGEADEGDEDTSDGSEGDAVEAPKSAESAPAAPANEEAAAALVEDDMPEPAAVPVEAAPAPVAPATVAEATEGAAAAAPVRTPRAPADAVLATEIDELPEFNLGDAELSMDANERANLANVGELSGDDLASDLFASEGDIWTDGSPSPSPAAIAGDGEAGRAAFAPASGASPAPAATAPTGDYGPFVFDPDTLELVPSRPAQTATAPDAAPAAVDAAAEETAAIVARPRPPEARQAPGAGAPTAMPGRLAYNPGDDPIVSTPLTAEQPRTYRSADLVELDTDPAMALQDRDARVAVIPARNTDPNAVRLLILPYHDRENPNNLIPATGGGEVVTTLYGTQLATAPEVQLMWDATGDASHTRLVSQQEALEMGALAGADFVMRGQVIEFRRAQSVPSLYSAVISTAVLAAQVFFAEMSGVDVATEVYRVSDGRCVMSRRDRAQQKYVVQAEKTVRRMAKGMADSVIKVILEADPEEMDPLIDEIAPVNLLASPR